MKLKQWIEVFYYASLISLGITALCCMVLFILVFKFKFT